MPFAKRGDVVHSEATSGFNNQKKSLLINGLAALGDSHRPLHIAVSHSIKPPHNPLIHKDQRVFLLMPSQWQQVACMGRD
jgi:hypothetical protein